MNTEAVGQQAGNRTVSPWFLARISLFWVGLSTMWGGLNIVYFPDRVESLVGTENKGTFLGLLLFSGLLVAVVVQPLMGAVSDRSTFRIGRRRPYMVVGSLLSAGFLLLIGAAGTFPLLFAAFIMLQISANSAHGPYQGVIPDLVPLRQRGRASGFFGLGNLVGTVIGALVGGYFLDSGQPEVYLIVAAVVLTAVAIVSALSTPEGPPPPVEDRRAVADELRTRVGELKSRPGFAWLMLSRLFFFMGLLAADNILLFTVRERLGMDQAGGPTSMALGVLLIIAAITSVPAGWLSDRFGRRRLVFIACGFGVLASVILMFSFNYPQLVAAMAVMGLAVGIFTAADWALAIDLIPDARAPGLYMGLTNLATA
ncbi:MAG: MFS transporter, partial [Chloroflexi bacterium]|nr:MFS transporter [Chloroflexota bacterium]